MLNEKKQGPQKITNSMIPFRWMSRSIETVSCLLRLLGADGKVTGNDNKRIQDLLAVWIKMFQLHNVVNILKITELNTLKSSILWHVNYISQ